MLALLCYLAVPGLWPSSHPTLPALTNHWPVCLPCWYLPTSLPPVPHLQLLLHPPTSPVTLCQSWILRSSEPFFPVHAGRVCERSYLKGPGGLASEEGGREATTCCWATVPQLFLPPQSVSKATWGCGQCGEEPLPELGGARMSSCSAPVSPKAQARPRPQHLHHLTPQARPQLAHPGEKKISKSGPGAPRVLQYIPLPAFWRETVPVLPSTPCTLFIQLCHTFVLFETGT